jgi:hypothetical protein
MKLICTMRYFLFCFLMITSTRSNTQYFPASDVADSIGKNKFYFVGQLHCNDANVIIEKELLFALNSKYGVQYDILEYAHSVAFLLNEYLQSGNDSLLSFINSKAGFSFIKAIRTYNGTAVKQIRFYGLDFENRENGKFTRRAIGIVLEKAKLTEGKLFNLCKAVINSLSSETEKSLKQLRAYLSENEKECRLQLKEDFTDVILIANAQYNFSPRRDDAMFDNFTRLYQELSRVNTDPSFFASFGTGHINPSNNKGLAMRLSKDNASPVARQVSISGVQYFNCGFKDNANRTSAGSLDLLCKNSSRYLQQVSNHNNQQISFISKRILNSEICDKADAFAGLFAIRNFNGSIFCDWE